MTRGIHLFTVPFDSGRKAERLGKGPDAFLKAGIVEALRRQGHSVEVTRIEIEQAFPLEVTVAFELASHLSRGVRSAIESGEFPLVLAGNCFSSMGTLAGLGREDIGIAWFDCHGDFHTSETTHSGFLDGMALAAVTGRCWSSLAAAVPGFKPVASDRVVHLGGRDFDPGEKEAMVSAGITVCDAKSLRHDPQAISFVGGQEPSRAAYLHLDLDTLDPSDGRVNSYQTSDGLSASCTEQLLRSIANQNPVMAAAVTAYEPDGDLDGRAREAGLRLILCLAELGCRQP